MQNLLQNAYLCLFKKKKSKIHTYLQLNRKLTIATWLTKFYFNETIDFQLFVKLYFFCLDKIPLQSKFHLPVLWCRVLMETFNQRF